MASASVGLPAVGARPGAFPADWPIRRLAAFALLTGYASVRWAHLVAPSADGRALAATLVALAVGIALASTREVRGRTRVGLLAALSLAGIFFALLASGLSLRLLLPAGWGELTAGIGQGLGALANTAIPYAGVDQWVRLVIVAGGALLALLAALVAFWPRSARLGWPVAALIVLAFLYGVPAVELHATRPYLDGALFTLAAAGLLWAERVPIGQGAVAAALVVATVVAGLAIGPRLDASRPWVNYEAIAASLSKSKGESFAWDHRYGPFYWPRDGREVLRISGAPLASYWKVKNLDAFDGLRWLGGGVLNPKEPDTEFAAAKPGWRVKVRVTVRAMRTSEFVAPGTTTGIERSPHGWVKVAPGTFATAGRNLGPGDSYIARAYTPRPSAGEMTSAGIRYPSFASSISDNLAISLPPQAGGPPMSPAVAGSPYRAPTDIYFPAWGDPSPTYSYPPDGDPGRNGEALVRASEYGRVYALARALKAKVRTPYAYVRAVQDYLGRGFTYDEAVPNHRIPLVSFLFTDRRGYCQQFSGAMALLLRMGGVPARVAVGFAPGSYDKQRKEYVVRDTDAHSWVEAYFPRYGWVPFDPTPAVAPPRSQAGAGRLPSAATGDSTDKGGVGDRGSDPHAAGSGGGGRGWGTPILIVAALGVGALAIPRLMRRRRGRPVAADPDLAELMRALWQTGRAPAPGMTLRRLETIMGGTPAAEGYVRALRVRRYGRGGPLPSARERRALRRELAAGLGLAGRLRALIAIPPRPSR
ncbi:MAG: protein-glutamine gamma-glutamyltransferase [Solirubrobacteraceae bacterium]|nr:protein-glutamine gamma-glutamyltransferase [Solirubrobacteraceae bacterium]